MKSKTSFFNKTIFLKNTSLYWPLWGLYTLILLFVQPLLIWVEFYTSMHYYGTDAISARLSDVISILSPVPMIIIVAIAAVLIGMALFSYMYNAKSANMIHALPVNKTELFGTNVISGLAFLMVPQILAFMVSVFVCLAYGMTRVEYLAMYLLVELAVAFIAFSFVVVCAMFTGQLFALPVYVLVVNFFSYIVYFLIMSVVSVFGVGVSQLSSNAEDIAELCCPLICFGNNIRTEHIYENELCVGMSISGISYILIYFVVALVLYAVAYITYQKRHIETAGELISVKWLKPVFRWGVGICGGIFGSLLVCMFIRELGIPYTLPVFILVMLFLGAVAYFGADMFVRKSFHVFKKQNWKNCGIFSVALLMTFFVLYGVADAYEKYIPKQEELAYATIDMGYQVSLYEDTADILALHEAILSEKEHWKRYEEEGYYWDGSYEYIQITYYFKNGDYILREYPLAYGLESINTIIAKIEELERDPENYLKHELSSKYDKVTEFGTGWLEARFKNKITEEDMEYTDINYESIALTPDMVEKLWAAVIADAKAGTLLKYNIYSDWAQEERQYIELEVNGTVGYYSPEVAQLQLEFRDPDREYMTSINASLEYFGYNGVYAEDVEHWSTAYLSFGIDCQNLVNTLIEVGVIQSVDDIYWGEVISESDLIQGVLINKTDEMGQFYKEFSDRDEIDIIEGVIIDAVGEKIEKELEPVVDTMLSVVFRRGDGTEVVVTSYSDDVIQVSDSNGTCYYEVITLAWEKYIDEIYTYSDAWELEY